ncbi:hypothetical protein K4L06_02750 [Lysobacter sp. BMK333-48F3]|uniref:hypothetical protein n=1 Tax=Lysobacter sp. BMK333-48F3 TaxID=2867962 RepID=UPI001C8C90A5|nr:hypothetical protein [Lysobacter sp. BMK333-48F3]MBX9400213.1 hypothetical protein [Lysobacter sp. BMK333-48F3]
MWRTLLFAAVIGGLCMSNPAQAELNGTTPEARRQYAQKLQQDRLQALTRRGRLDVYQQLIGANSRVSAALPANAEAASRDAAIDLAALGITAADVKSYRDLNKDLFDIAYRFFVGSSTTPAEQMLLADTVVIATAGKTQASRARTDGFLAEIPFTVVRSLKGNRAAGDVILVPRHSGPTGPETEQIDFSEAKFAPGKKYLLVLSKNWYEQYVALKNKQAEPHFTALPYLAYEVSPAGTLLPGPQPARSGVAPKDLKSIEAELRRYQEKHRTGGAL